MSSSNRRRRMFPDRKMQFRITIQIVGMVYLYLVIFSILTNLGQIRLVLFGESAGQAYLDAVDRLTTFVGMMIMPLALTVICVSLHSLLFSHRLAGPLYRLKCIIRQAKTGAIPAEVSLRRRDFFHDLCDELNGLCGRLRTDMDRCHELSSRLADAGELLVGEGQLTPETQDRLVEVANATQELRQVVESYELAPDPVADEKIELEPAPIPAR